MVREQIAQALRVTEQAEQMSRASMAFGKEVLSRSAQRSMAKGSTLLKGTLAQSWKWRMRIFHGMHMNERSSRKMENYLEKSEEIQVGIDELEDSLICPEDGKIIAVSIAELAGRRRIQEVPGYRHASRH